jgi:hypothetical protein
MIDTERESSHEKEAAHRDQMVPLLEALDVKQIARSCTVSKGDSTGREWIWDRGGVHSGM